MMSTNHWLLLWLIFLSYLFLGAFMFYSIEGRYEEYRRVDENPEEMDIEDLLNTYYSWTNNRAHKQLLIKLKQRCNITLTNLVLHSGDIIESEDEFQWTFYNSFFFALTTLSTIGQFTRCSFLLSALIALFSLTLIRSFMVTGYGNLHPTSCLGRMVLIVYSLLGIPLNGIVLTQLGEFFASTFLRAHERYKDKRFETRYLLLVDIASYLVPGILLFIFLPSGFFVYFEGWSFEQSIYFAYVTLTTIGFGDLVAGQSATDELWYNIYKVVLIFWIMFGLGYLVMILGFISRAMRCKKMARLERKLVQNVKQTHSKILNGFNRDVSYVRRLLNELYLLKFKPVYQDEEEEDEPYERRRTYSCPNLTKWPDLEKISRHITSSETDDEEETRLQFEKLRMKRRKALSENLFKHRDLKTRSDTDLTKINKDATFNNIAYVERNELMARVADAFHHTYSQMHQVHNNYACTDEEMSPKRKISQFERELLELSTDIFSNDTANDQVEKDAWYSAQWTWPRSESTIDKLPDTKHLDIPTEREKRRSIPLPGVQSLRRVSMAALNFLTPSKFGRYYKDEEAKDVELEEGQKVKRARRTGKTACPGVKRYSLENNYEQMYECLNYLTQVQMQEANFLSTLKNQINNLASSNPVLDKTSIGDFLRIVNSLTPETKSPKTNSSPLFTLFQTDLNTQPIESSRRCSLLPKEDTIGSNHRFSLAPLGSKPDSVTRHKSFSAQRRISPSARLPRIERSLSGQANLPPMRKFRSDFSPNLPSSDSSFGLRESTSGIRKVRRFLVKPVTLPTSTPEIIISPSSPDHNEKRRRKSDQQEEQYHFASRL